MILINENAPTEVISFLEKKDRLLKLPDLQNVSDETKRHPDLGCTQVGNDLILCPEFFGKVPNAICGEKTPTDGYPSDVLYNAACVGKHLFCNVNKTDPQVLSVAEKNGIKPVNVKQGYAKCNIVNVGDRAIITEDEGIAAVAEKEDIPVLCVKRGEIALNGYPHGFIGGASLLFGEELIFTGDLSAHSDFEKIVSFVSKFGLKTVFIENFPLTDVGSPVFLKNI